MPQSFSGSSDERNFTNRHFLLTGVDALHSFESTRNLPKRKGFYRDCDNMESDVYEIVNVNICKISYNYTMAEKQAFGDWIRQLVY